MHCLSSHVSSLKLRSFCLYLHLFTPLFSPSLVLGQSPDWLFYNAAANVSISRQGGAGEDIWPGFERFSSCRCKRQEGIGKRKGSLSQAISCGSQGPTCSPESVRKASALCSLVIRLTWPLTAEKSQSRASFRYTLTLPAPKGLPRTLGQRWSWPCLRLLPAPGDVARGAGQDSSTGGGTAGRVQECSRCAKPI